MSQILSQKAKDQVATGELRRLRVAQMVQTDGPGGAETMVLRLSEELRSRNHTVTPVTVRDGVGWLGSRYQEIGFAPRTVRIGRRWIDRTLMTDLLAVLRTEQIELVHSHEFEMAVYGAAACRWQGIPHVLTMHGGLTVWKAWQRRFALRWAVRASAASVVVSTATRDQFAHELGVSPKRFRVIPNGVPLRDGNPAAVRAEFKCQPDDVVLLAVGNLERNKGHEELLIALADLHRQGSIPHWKLIIAGGRGGPEHDSLVRLTRDHGLTDHVHIALGRNDIPDLQALADIFVMPSLWEGMPMALLEGMVAGNAIVASNTGGIPEAVRHGVDGLLVPPGDPQALAAALARLLINRDYRKTMGAAAKHRGLAEFTLQSMTSQYERLYQEVLSTRNKSNSAHD